jgi:hypothetical protein
MNKTITITLIVIGSLIFVALVFGAGLWFGRSAFGFPAFGPAGMLNYASAGSTEACTAGFAKNRPGSMMGWGQETDLTSCGSLDNSYNRMGALSPMGLFGAANSASAAPLTVDQTTQAVEAYLQDINNPDLEISEIMIFDNNAYAIVIEKSTGIGAMELLVDPATLAVYPEYGPNMMWNLKYGHMRTGGGMMGGFRGRMGGLALNNADAAAEMTVSPEQALTIAQDYMDGQFPGYQVAEEAEPFYGYYTMDFMKDGQPIGMLSVNGFSGQVFLHTWHGTFIEMTE